MLSEISQSQTDKYCVTPLTLRYLGNRVHVKCLKYRETESGMAVAGCQGFTGGDGELVFSS